MVDLDTVVSLCKRRGFVFQSSEIYGGLGSAWDYGPLGVEYKNNIKRLWWRDMVLRREDMVGVDCAITMHPTVWKASGHADHFADPFTGCQECNRYYRADHLKDQQVKARWVQALQKALQGPAAQKDREKALRNWAASDGKKAAPGLPWVKDPSRSPLDGLEAFLDGSRIACPNCGGAMSEPRPANLMLKTVLGPVEATGTVTWLRPETAQGIFVNFENVLQSSRKKLPFGIAQVGKSFRNEITPGNFTFRTREFEQMEIEYFCRPGTDEKLHQEWIDTRHAWYLKYGMRSGNLKVREHGKDELAHYAKRCVDLEYNFPMGWSELEGIANRADYDLKQHSKFSGRTLEYFDDETKAKVVPYVIEPSAGADRSALAFLIDAYREEEVKGEKRVVLGFHPELAPVKVAVLPLLKKSPKIVATARSLAARLRERWPSVYDDTAAIGKLYRRQDEVGTPFCVTVDVLTVGDEQAAPDHKVTIRERDSMHQIRVPVAELESVAADLLAGKWREVAPRYPMSAATA